MSISEIYGEFRCGKTQICHTMAVIAQLPKEMGGAEGKVAWIDTEGTFRPERICQIAERFGVDPEQACDNICICRGLNSEHQMELLDVLAFNFCTGEYRLLVIDSVMALFRTDYSGRGELADRQQALGQFLKRLCGLAEEFNICVLMVRSGQSWRVWPLLTEPRPTRSSPIQVRVLSLLESMDASLSVATFLLMLPLPESFFAKAVVRSVLRRSLILQVS